MKGGLGRPEAESVVVFCRQDRHFESGLAEGSDPLLGIKVRRSEQGWTFLAVTPLASGEGVHSEMEESGHFQILPIKLLLGGDAGNLQGTQDVSRNIPDCFGRRPSLRTRA